MGIQEVQLVIPNNLLCTEILTSKFSLVKAHMPNKVIDVWRLIQSYQSDETGGSGFLDSDPCYLKKLDLDDRLWILFEHMMTTTLPIFMDYFTFSSTMSRFPKFGYVMVD